MFFEFNYPDMKYTHAQSCTVLSADPKKLPLYKLIYVVSGGLFSPQIQCNAGQLCLIDKNGKFTFDPQDGPVEYYAVYFSEYIIPGDLTALIHYGAGTYSVTDTPIPSLLPRFDQHLENMGSANQVEIKMLFRCVLTEILVYFAKLAEQRTAVPGILHGNMEPVLNFISRNLERPLQIQDICAEFHYSRSHLCKVFAQVTGVPIMQYIRTARAEYAQRLLHSGMPATEVARFLGYSDYASFYRMYCKYAGCTPSDTLRDAAYEGNS